MLQNHPNRSHVGLLKSANIDSVFKIEIIPWVRVFPIAATIVFQCAATLINCGSPQEPGPS